MWADYMHVNIHILPILQILLFYKVIVPKTSTIWPGIHTDRVLKQPSC